MVLLLTDELLPFTCVQVGLGINNISFTEEYFLFFRAFHISNPSQQPTLYPSLNLALFYFVLLNTLRFVPVFVVAFIFCSTSPTWNTTRIPTSCPTSWLYSLGNSPLMAVYIRMWSLMVFSQFSISQYLFCRQRSILQSSLASVSVVFQTLKQITGAYMICIDYLRHIQLNVDVDHLHWDSFDFRLHCVMNNEH